MGLDPLPLSLICEKNSDYYAQVCHFCVDKVVFKIIKKQLPCNIHEFKIFLFDYLAQVK